MEITTDETSMSATLDSIIGHVLSTSFQENTVFWILISGVIGGVSLKR